MKTCTKCNISFPDDKRFCKKCGGILITANNESVKPKEHDNKEKTTVTGMSIAPGSGTFKERMALKEDIQKSILKKALIFGVPAIIVIVVAIILVLYFKQKGAWDEAKEKNTIISYQDYLNEYPNGRYVEDAKNIVAAKEDSIAALERAIQDSIALAQKNIEDSIAAAQKDFDDAQGSVILLGTWKGKFSNKTMVLVINSVVNNTVAGYDILNGKQRPFTGTFHDEGSNYGLTLNEPGDDNGDGKFEISIDKSSLIAVGYWQQFKGNLRYDFTFYKEKDNDNQKSNSADVSGTWIVILGSFQNRSEALSFINKKNALLTNSNTSLRLEIVETNNYEKLTKNLYVASGGKNISKAEAQELLDQYKHYNLNGYIKDAGN